MCLDWSWRTWRKLSTFLQQGNIADHSSLCSYIHWYIGKCTAYPTSSVLSSFYWVLVDLLCPTKSDKQSHTNYESCLLQSVWIFLIRHCCACAYLHFTPVWFWSALNWWQQCILFQLNSNIYWCSDIDGANTVLHSNNIWLDLGNPTNLLTHCDFFFLYFELLQDMNLLWLGLGSDWVIKRTNENK